MRGPMMAGNRGIALWASLGTALIGSALWAGVEQPPRKPVLQTHTEGRTGWVRAADLQPHAALVFLDGRSGRLLRRLATKGQEGPVSEGRFLWTAADTGLTRVFPAEHPIFWSNRKAWNGESPVEDLK